MTLDQLLQRTDIWRAGEGLLKERRSVTSGFRALDALLPGRGWPIGAMTEILIPPSGRVGLGLVMPLLRRLTQEQKWVAWIDPPHLPYAPALSRQLGTGLSRLVVVRTRSREDGLWALEQSLRSGACGAVLAWLETEEEPRCLRRLQLGAEAGGACGILFRPSIASRRPSPAALRLAVETSGNSLRVIVLKCRGGWPGARVHLPCDHPSVMPRQRRGLSEEREGVELPVYAASSATVTNLSGVPLKT